MYRTALNYLSPWLPLMGLLCLSLSCSSGRVLRLAREMPAAGEKAGIHHRQAAAYHVEGERFRAERGFVTVAENRHDPASRRIRLPYFRIFSQNASGGSPVFYLTGGPGISNMNFKPPPALLREHDVVLVGYRGVDGSSRLRAPGIRRAVTGGRYILGPEAIDSLRQAISAGFERWRAEGVDLRGYTIVEVMHDLETVRRELGYGRINLLSESYGTRIALIYARAFPENIHRSVMIGANPPGRFVWEPGMIDDQIRAYSKRYAARLGPADSLVRAMKKALKNMPESWMGLSVDPGRVKLMLFVMMFHRNSAALALDACLDAADGDYSGLALLSRSYDLALPGMFVWGDFLLKAYSADYDPERDYAAELNPPEAIIGSPLSMLFWAAVPPDIPRIEEQYRVPLHSPVETLIISGNLDLSTPARYAREEILPGLPNGRQIVFADQGHVRDLWRVKGTDVPGLIARYYKTGRIPAGSPTVEAVTTGVFPGLSFMAKGLVVMGGLLLAGGLSWMMF